jgi:hypothetical protein
MFGVRHEPGLRAPDVFGGKLWVEVDQDANFSWKSYEDFLTNRNTCIKDESGFHKAVRSMPVAHVASPGRGKAVLMNLSPQWYNAYRVSGAEPARRRDTFMRHIAAAGVVPWVRIAGAGEREHGYEITSWNQPPAGARPARTILFVCQNPEIHGTSLGGGNSAGLKTAVLPIKLRFTREIRGVRDERTGRPLGEGREFAFDWKQNEAIVLSFDSGKGEPVSGAGK